MAFKALGEPLQWSAFADMLAEPAVYEHILDRSVPSGISREVLMCEQRLLAHDLYILEKGPQRMLQDKNVDRALIMFVRTVGSVDLCVEARWSGDRLVFDRVAGEYDHDLDGLKMICTSVLEDNTVRLRLMFIPRSWGFCAMSAREKVLLPGDKEWIETFLAMLISDCSFCLARGDVCTCPYSMQQGLYNQFPSPTSRMGGWDAMRYIIEQQAKTGWFIIGGDNGMKSRVLQVCGHGRERERIQRMLSQGISKRLTPPEQKHPRQETTAVNVDKDSEVTAAKSESANRCTLCGRHFKYPSHLKRHVECVHTDQPNHPCPQCPKTFKQRGHLLSHQAHVHGAKDRYQCKDCGAQFAWKVSLNKHRRRHLNSSSEND